MRTKMFLPVLMMWLGVLMCRGAADELQHQEFKVADVKREGLFHIPTSAKTSPTPVVFVFHGHGGSARNAARSFGLEQYWPEAIVVYLQGLDTPGRLTDPEGARAGWQMAAGAQGDRDLKFFDVVLDQLKRDYKVDTKRIYATGHSNGAAFDYLLWLQRGDVFAAFAPSAAAAGYALKLQPKPAMIIGGEKDPLVKFSWQQATMEAVRKVNGCDAKGTPWHKLATLYPSASGNPVVTLIHSGGHEFDREAPELIVQFFKEHPER